MSMDLRWGDTVLVLKSEKYTSEMVLHGVRNGIGWKSSTAVAPLGCFPIGTMQR